MINKVKELLSKGKQYSLNNPSEFAKIYKDVFNEPVCSYCPGKIEAKFIELANLNLDKINTMQSKKYRMIPGKLIDTTMSSSGPNGQYTDKNITDEVAIELIKRGHGKMFIGNPVVEALEETEPETNKEKDPTEELAQEANQVSEAPKSLDTYSYKRLVELCEKREYPKEEWKNFQTRKTLAEYVKSK